MVLVLSVLLDLFLAFLKLGLVMFGGGHIAIPILRYELVENRGLLTEREFVDLVTVTESLPGPITVKMATCVGYRIAGIVGSLVATVAIVLPTFITALTVITVLYQYYQHSLVTSLLRGIRGAVLGLLFAAVLTFARGSFRDLSHTQMIITVLLTVTSLILVSLLKVEPIIVVALAALIGLILGFTGFW